MRFTCPACSKSYRLPPERLGASGRAQISCPNCKAVVLVQSSGDSENLSCQLLQGTKGAERAAPTTSTPPVAAAATTTAAAAAAPTEGDGGGWFVAIDREKVGPLTAAQVAAKSTAGVVTAQTLAWKKGMQGWVKAAEIDELVAILTAHPPRPAGPRPSAPVPPRATGPAAQAAAQGKPAQAATARAAAVAPPADDDAGPTLEAAIPAALRQPAASAKAAAQQAKPSQQQAAAAHGDAFFGGHDLQDINLSLPDPNKHKPTKEEYQNLLQEFSVMFRLDKRSKRQKVLMAVVLTSLLVGVISSGVVLWLSAKSKSQLIKDSKEILAVFDMGYKKAVTPSLPADEEPAKAEGGATAPAGTAAATAKKPAQVSQIADQLSVLVRKKRAANKQSAPSVGSGQQGTVNAAQEAADLEAYRKKKAQEEAAARAAELASLGIKDKHEENVGALVGEVLTAGEVRRMCKDRSGELMACGKKFGAEGGFSLRLTINVNGRVVRASASAEGASNAELSGCVKSRLGNARLNSPKEETTYDCKIN